MIALVLFLISQIKKNYRKPKELVQYFIEANPMHTSMRQVSLVLAYFQYLIYQKLRQQQKKKLIFSLVLAY